MSKVLTLVRLFVIIALILIYYINVNDITFIKQLRYYWNYRVQTNIVYIYYFLNKRRTLMSDEPQTQPQYGIVCGIISTPSDMYSFDTSFMEFYMFKGQIELDTLHVLVFEDIVTHQRFAVNMSDLMRDYKKYSEYMLWTQVTSNITLTELLAYDINPIIPSHMFTRGSDGQVRHVFDGAIDLQRVCSKRCRWSKTS